MTYRTYHTNELMGGTGPFDVIDVKTTNPLDAYLPNLTLGPTNSVYSSNHANMHHVYSSSALAGEAAPAGDP